ncbi:hypothetical protein IQ238_22890 [Pleurocapsales cyanobacterium LEGE 06147]|nr:hypothetical protein [Pleurocapsales cyanobacterium LEGE 06147]
MPKQISIEPHLSVEKLEKRSRQSKEPVKRTHYQIIWLIAGMVTQRREVQEILFQGDRQILKHPGFIRS